MHYLNELISIKCKLARAIHTCMIEETWEHGEPEPLITEGATPQQSHASDESQ